MSDPFTCETCGARLDIGSFPFCPHGSTLPYRPFESFETEVGGERVVVDSITRLRRIEDETRRQYEAGEKVAPMVFRQYSQDRSNLDRNTLENLHPQRRLKESMREYRETRTEILRIAESRRGR